MNFVFNYGQLLNTAGTVCDERYHIRPLPGMDLLRTKTVHEVVSKCWHNLFYAQSPDFPKPGLCYYPKFM